MCEIVAAPCPSKTAANSIASGCTEPSWLNTEEARVLRDYEVLLS